MAIALLCSGCVAFNVGKPKEFTHVEKHVDIASAPSSADVVSAEAHLRTQGGEAIVSLAADVKEEFGKSAWEESVTVRQRKRLAVGLFPGAAEFMFMPKGALRPAIMPNMVSGSQGDPRRNAGSYVCLHLAFACSFGLIHLGTTFYSLIVAPSDDWRCGHDFIDPDAVRRVTRDGRVCYDASQSQKLRSLQKFNATERNQIGVSTCLYQTDRGSSAFLSHLGLVGIHKYLAVFVEDPKTSPSVPDGFETRRRTAFATGPYIAELSIPVLGYNERKHVSDRETQASFTLPALERDSTVEAVVSFHNDDSAGERDPGGITEQAVRKADGRQWRFDILLKGTDVVPDAPPQSGILPYHIVGIRRNDEGRYEIRVEIRDQSKTFSINHLVRPDVQRMIRDDFMERNPSVSQQDVRYRINYETDKGGKTLIYTGWAFSVRPVEDGWRYDPATRRGWIRLRIVGDLSREEAMRWARENISAIIGDKNVVLVAGKTPPPGATYRCLDGNVSDDGVLKVDFEAVQ